MMGIFNEDSHPLVHDNKISSNNLSDSQSDGYVNEAICDSEKLITTRVSYKQDFNHQTFQIHYPHTSYNNSLKLSKIRPTLPVTSSATVHAPEKSTKNNICYNNTTTEGKLPRNDSLTIQEQNDLLEAPWYQAGLPRKISLEILSKQNIGSFLVRRSESKLGCFALSLRVRPPKFVTHYLIMRTSRGFKIKVV